MFYSIGPCAARENISGLQHRSQQTSPSHSRTWSSSRWLKSSWFSRNFLSTRWRRRRWRRSLSTRTSTTSCDVEKVNVSSTSSLSFLLITSTGSVTPLWHLQVHRAISSLSLSLSYSLTHTHWSLSLTNSDAVFRGDLSVVRKTKILQQLCVSFSSPMKDASTRVVVGTRESFIFELQTSPIIYYVLCQTTQIFTSWTSYFWDFEVCSSCLDSKITDHTLGGFSISLVEFAGYNDEFNMNSSILGKNLWNLKYLWLNSLSR